MHRQSLLKKTVQAILTFFLFISLYSYANAQTYVRIQGYVEEGGFQFSGSSSAKVQRSYPNSTVTVYVTGTTTLATIYATRTGTLKSNPLTADNKSYFYFYVANGCYDLRFSGGGILTPYFIGDICVRDSTVAGTVTSVGIAAPSEITVSGSPIIDSGIITLDWAVQNNNLVFASPCDSPGTPLFRPLCREDLLPDMGIIFGTQDEGVDLPPEPKINFIGSNVSCVDDSLNLRINCTIAVPTPTPFVAIQTINSDATVNQTLAAGTGINIVDNGSGTHTISTTASTSPLTTKGDIWGYSTTNARIPVGSNGQFLKADSAQTLGIAYSNISSTDVSGLPYDLATQVDGSPTSSAVVLRFVAIRNVNLSSTGHRCNAATSATAQTDFVVAVNGVSKGTLRFAASGTTCSIVSGSTASIVAGDLVTITAPASADATLANIAFTLQASLP